MQRLDLTGICLRPETARDALASLELASSRLRAAGDLRAAFADVYAIITRRVVEAIEGQSGPLLLEPEWFSRVAARFATLYFDALSSPGAGIRSTAWRIASERSSDAGALPGLHVVLGINAHVNFDLAIGMRDAIVAAGHARDSKMLRRYRRDFDAVNEILRDAVPECLALLARRYDCSVSRGARAVVGGQRAVGALSVATLVAWRARVWQDVQSLLEAGDASAEEEIVARMDELSERMARGACLAANALTLLEASTRRLTSPVRTLALAAAA